MSLDKQQNYEQRIAKLEHLTQQYVAQVSSLSVQITQLQQQFATYQQETNDKLDRIYTAIRKDDSDDESPFALKRSKSRHSSRASTIPLQSMHQEISTQSPSKPFEFDLTAIPNAPFTSDQSNRLDRLEATLTASMQQVSQVSGSLTNLLTPQRQGQNSPSSHSFTSPVTPSTWEQLAQPVHENEDFKYEMDINDQNSNKSS